MINRPIRYYYYRMLRQRGTPRQLAAGLAVGVFCGLAAPYGLQILAIVLAALLFRQFNRIAALFGSMVSNPLTIPFLYVFYYRFGQRLIGSDNIEPLIESSDQDAVWSMLSNWQAHRETLLAMGSSALIFATLCACTVYFVSHPLLVKYQNRRKKRLQDAFNKFVEGARSFAQNRSKVKNLDERK